jgi:hypothetical protein
MVLRWTLKGWGFRQTNISLHGQLNGGRYAHASKLQWPQMVPSKSRIFLSFISKPRLCRVKCPKYIQIRDLEEISTEPTKHTTQIQSFHHRKIIVNWATFKTTVGSVEDYRELYIRYIYI